MKNYAASVRAKLTIVANRENIRFQQIVVCFLHERLLCRLLEAGRYDHDILKNAIRETFQTRQTSHPAEHPLFTVGFGENTDRHKQWKAFLQKSKIAEIDFREVHRQIWMVLEAVNREILLEGDV